VPAIRLSGLFVDPRPIFENEPGAVAEQTLNVEFDVARHRQWLQLPARV
jgi:hypothetical protein